MYSRRSAEAALATHADRVGGGGGEQGGAALPSLDLPALFPAHLQHVADPPGQLCPEGGQGGAPYHLAVQHEEGDPGPVGGVLHVDQCEAAKLNSIEYLTDPV